MSGKLLGFFFKVEKKSKRRQEVIRKGWWNSEKAPRQLNTEPFRWKSEFFVLCSDPSGPHPHLPAGVAAPCLGVSCLWYHMKSSILVKSAEEV